MVKRLHAELDRAAEARISLRSSAGKTNVSRQLDLEKVPDFFSGKLSASSPAFQVSRISLHGLCTWIVTSSVLCYPAMAVNVPVVNKMHTFPPS